MLKSECTEAEWEVFSAKRRQMDASSDEPIKGADKLLAKYWGVERTRGRLPARSSRYLTGDEELDVKVSSYTTYSNNPNLWRRYDTRS
jgi:hypothetical protein